MYDTTQVMAVVRADEQFPRDDLNRYNLIFHGLLLTR